MNTNTNKYQKLANFLAGHQAPEELAKLKKDLSTDPDTADQLNLFEQVWQLEVGDQKISERIKAKTKRKISRKFILRINTNLLGYAAAFLFIFGLSYVLYFWGKHYPLEHVEYVSTTGQVENYKLPDGSNVWLNSKSKMSYTQHLWGGNRHVSLEGEAYFEVTSDKKHPFVVETTDAFVKVTGTRFSVSAYADDSFINTRLEEGGVTFIDKYNNTNHILLPKQRASLNKSSKALTIVSEPNMKIGSWRNGELTFYDESLSSICRKLERRFDVKIEFADQQLEGLRYTAEFEQENLAQILKFIELASALEIKQTDKTYIFSLKNNELPMN
ncbi:FecR family protein [Sunxiuqinia sp. sy24]|uniref:FecR family protein n=1 Tax=Sunxiuqinia sp. sy24 TaxID=3461495 RepID=UPI004046101A